MSLAPEQTGIGIHRHFTAPGVDPYDQVDWERRDARITDYRDGSGRVRAARRRGAGHLVGERDEHPLPEVLPRHPRHARARDLAAPGRRPRRRHDHGVGHPGWLLHRRPRGRDVPGRAEAPHRAAEGGVQLAGVVQHRREGRKTASVSLLYFGCRRHHGLDPQLVRRGRHDLQGRFRIGHQPLEDPLLQGAPARWRHRVGSRELHAGCRCVGGHHQVGGKSGAPRRWSSSTSIIPTSKSSSGARRSRSARRAAARLRLRHGSRRLRQPLDPVPERKQLSAGHRRLHARPSSKTSTGTSAR